MTELRFDAHSGNDAIEGAAGMAYNLIILLHEKGVLSDQDLIVLAAVVPGLSITKEESA